MAIIEQNGVNFNSVKTSGVKLSTGPIMINGFNGVDNEDGGMINAVDIDWNGADWNGSNVPSSPASTITTTGLLLGNIKYIESKVSELENVEAARKLTDIDESGDEQISVNGTNAYNIVIVKGNISGFSLSEAPLDKNMCHVIFKKSSEASDSCSISLSNGILVPAGNSNCEILTPDGEDINLDMSNLEYAEMNFLRIGSTIYVKYD